MASGPEQCERSVFQGCAGREDDGCGADGRCGERMIHRTERTGLANGRPTGVDWKESDTGP
jgi:hypothetical protein